MGSENYRFYRLDGAGMIHEAQWLQADGDAAAIAMVIAEHGDATCEIWQGQRLVAKTEPKRLQA